MLNTFTCALQLGIMRWAQNGFASLSGLCRCSERNTQALKFTGLPFHAQRTIQHSATLLTQSHACAGPDGTITGSLLDLLDATKSRAGARHLRQWLSQPLVDVDAIRERQDAVAELLQDAELHSRVQAVRGTVLWCCLQSLGDVMGPACV